MARKKAAPSASEQTEEESVEMTEAEELHALLSEAGDGSSFVKERGAWRVTFVKNGAPFGCSGATITEAVASIGAVRTHDSHGNVI